MALAAIDSTGYQIVLILHIVLVVVGFGALFAAPMLARVEGASTVVATGMASYVQKVAVPATALAGILGFALIGMSDDLIGFGETWVSVSIVLWIVEIAVLWFGVLATETKIAAGDRAAESRRAMFTGISHLLLVVLVYLMIFKPGA